jgi:putative membrane protein
MQWWCSAQGTQWTWRWVAYPGVWLFVLAAVVISVALVRGAPWRGMTFAHRASLIGGLLALWIALDWPLGPLAAGYLSFAHAIQFLMTAFVAAPLLLYGLRAAIVDRAARAPWTGLPAAAGTLLTNPLVAAVLFNIIVAVTHVPKVVDGYMKYPLGAFLIDSAWLLGGLLFWSSIIVPVPDHGRFKLPLKLLYLLLGTLFHTIVAMILVSAEFPLYSTYELAPPFPAIDALTDQKLAGGVMELGGLGLIFLAASIIFFKWANEDRGKVPR